MKITGLDLLLEILKKYQCIQEYKLNPVIECREGNCSKCWDAALSAEIEIDDRDLKEIISYIYEPKDTYQN